MEPFEARATSFGRHETFHLRFGWLTKGFRAWSQNNAVFSDEDSTLTLGVGKNMVHAIQYWLVAAQVLKPQAHGLSATPIGDALFSARGWDPYVEDDTTLWLLHWLIASNAQHATAIYWFFNRFHKPEFGAAELVDALAQFCSENTSSKVSRATLKHDVSLLLRMYEPSSPSRSVPLEEALDSPLSTLGLVHAIEGTRLHHARPGARPRLPIAAFAYAVTELFDATRQAALPVERLSRDDGRFATPGRVYRLTDDALLRKLEELVTWLPDCYELRETAGVHQLYRLSDTTPMDILSRHYADEPLLQGVT